MAGPKLMKTVYQPDKISPKTFERIYDEGEYEKNLKVFGWPADDSVANIIANKTGRSIDKIKQLISQYASRPGMSTEESKSIFMKIIARELKTWSLSDLSPEDHAEYHTTHEMMTHFDSIAQVQLRIPISVLIDRGMPKRFSDEQQRLANKLIQNYQHQEQIRSEIMDRNPKIFAGGEVPTEEPHPGSSPKVSGPGTKPTYPDRWPAPVESMETADTVEDMPALKGEGKTIRMTIRELRQLIHEVLYRI